MKHLTKTQNSHKKQQNGHEQNQNRKDKYCRAIKTYKIYKKEKKNEALNAPFSS